MSEDALRIVVGLGNPGPSYDSTRHNAGFWLADELARRDGASFRSESRFQAEVCRVGGPAGPLWVVKPLTYMNRSGLAVRAFCSFYKLAPSCVLVVHDELDLPPGTVRFKRGGGHGGHNGLRDIVAQLGSADFRRLRLGIGHPGVGADVTGYVLNRPRAEERDLIEDGIARALNELPRLIAGDFAPAMNVLHSR